MITETQSGNHWQYACERCGRTFTYARRKPLHEITCGHQPKKPAESQHWAACPHRGPVIGTINSRAAGCGCGSSRTEFFDCRRFKEPVLKQCSGWAASANRERLVEACPGYTGRTCRECKVPVTSQSVDGIVGLDANGRCDVLHIMGKHWWPRGDKMCCGIPPEIIAARKVSGTIDEDRAAIAVVEPRVVAIHALEHQLDTVRKLAGEFPRTAFVCIFHGSQNVIARTAIWAPMQRDFLQLSNELQNVWYATPEPTVPWPTLGYQRAVVWPNTMPVGPIVELPSVDPSTLLLAGRMDVIKCYPVAMLAAGIINRQRPVRVVTIIQSRDQALDAFAELAGVQIENQPWMEWDAFHGFIRERVSVTICPSLTDSFHYVAWDSLAQGRPAVGSQTTRYLPSAWQADPNDPRDVAQAVLAILDDYQAASQRAWCIASELAERQRAAYIDLIDRLSRR